MNKIFMGTLLIIALLLGFYLGTAIYHPSPMSTPPLTTGATSVSLPLETSITSSNKATLIYIINGTVTKLTTKPSKQITVRTANGSLIGPYTVPDDLDVTKNVSRKIVRLPFDQLAANTKVRINLQFDIVSHTLENGVVYNISLQ